MPRPILAYKRFPGILAVSITPFTGFGAVDHDALRTHVKNLVDSGVHGIIPCGSTGEFTSLSYEEWSSVIDTSVKAVAGRVPVIAGAAGCSTSDTIARCIAAADLGASAVMTVSPFYGSLSQEELYGHYASVAAALEERNTNLPDKQCGLIIYNNPFTTRNDISALTVARLARAYPSVWGVKESTGSLQRVLEIVAAMRSAADDSAPRDPAAFDILCGCDTLAWPMFSLVDSNGQRLAAGWVSPPANCVPKSCVALWEAVMTGDAAKASALHDKLDPLLQLFEGSGKYVALAKAGVNLSSLQVGKPRLPIAPVSDSLRSQLSNIMTTNGLE